MRKDISSLAWVLGVALAASVAATGVAGAIYALRVSAPPPTHRPDALMAREIALRSFASVVCVAMKTPTGHPLSLGSGFIVERGVVVTNFHVIRGAGSGSVRLIGDPESVPIEAVLAVDPDLDLVLLSVPKLQAAPLTLGDSAKSSIGDEVYVVSNPQQLEGTFSQGIISGKRKLEQVRLLQITAPISAGSSGGPVLDREAHVIGIATSSLKDGQSLNFAITADHLVDLVGRKGPPQELTKVTRPKPVVVARSGTPSLFTRFRRLLRLP